MQMGDEFDISLVKNPNDHYKGLERELIVKDLLVVAREGFGTPMEEDDVENHVLGVENLYLIRHDSGLVGFSSYDNLSFEGQNILYLSGIVLRKKFQRKGLFRRANERAISDGDFDFLTMRTQNPAVYVATSNIVDELYPNAEKETPEEIRKIARFVAKDFLKMDNFDDRNLVGRKTYGVSLNDYIPKTSASDLFDNALKIDYNAGDSVILVGTLKK